MRIIILSAFGGRLRSEPMEWPDEPQQIRMPISHYIGAANWSIGKDVPSTGAEMVMKCGLFQHTGKYEVLPNKRTAPIYELISI